ncbi:MAG: hypothetical protein AB1742_00060 [bacterium]
MRTKKILILTLLLSVSAAAAEKGGKPEQSDGMGFLKKVEERYGKLKDYGGVFEYVEQKDKKQARHVCDFIFMKPDYQRMKVLEGAHKGSSVAYNPSKSTDKCVAKPAFPPVPVALSKNDKRLEGFFDSGWDSDVRFMKRLAGSGTVEIAGEESVEGRKAYLLVIKPGKDEEVSEMKAWIDREELFLVQYECLKDGEFHSRKTWRKVRLNPGLKPDDFVP